MDDVNNLMEELEHHVPIEVEMEFEIEQQEQLIDFKGDYYAK